MTCKCGCHKYGYKLAGPCGGCDCFAKEQEKRLGFRAPRCGEKDTQELQNDYRGEGNSNGDIIKAVVNLRDIMLTPRPHKKVW